MSKIDDQTIVMKATTTETGLLTGLQVQLANQQIVTMHIVTSESSDAVDSVQFYRGKSPYDQDLARERKRLEKDFEKYKQDFLMTHSKGSQSTILKEMQSHYYARDNLGAKRSANNIEIAAQRYLEIGENGYLYFDVTNYRKEDLDPRLTTLTSIKKSGVGFVELKELKDAIFCDNASLKNNQTAKCSIAFSLKQFSKKEEKLKLYLQVSEDVTDVYVLKL